MIFVERNLLLFFIFIFFILLSTFPQFVMSVKSVGTPVAARILKIWVNQLP
jgi:hypothetical protein